MKPKTFITIFSLIILSTLLFGAGCTPAAPKPVNIVQFPTLSGLTETNVFLSTLWTATQTPTETLIPTQTDTLTPSVTAFKPSKTATSPTIAPFPAGTANALLTFSITPTFHTTKTPSPTPTYWPITKTPVDWACTVISSDPNGYKAFHKGEDFDGHFTVLNSGGKEWNIDKMRYRFVSGTAIHKHYSVDAIPRGIQLNHTLDITIDMTAPTTPGRYFSVWSFEHSEESLCLITFSLTVLDE